MFIVTDASGGVTLEAHDMAVRRMVAAGAVPITWMAVLGELQRDWAQRKPPSTSQASFSSMATPVLSRWRGNCSFSLGALERVPNMPTASAPIRIGCCLSLTGLLPNASGICSIVSPVSNTSEFEEVFAAR
jgi:hypothetical protein